MLTSLAPHVHRLKYILNDNSTLILTGVGVVGTVGTAVLTGRASFRAAEIIAEEEEKHHLLLEEGAVHTIGLSKTEKTKLVWRLYLPPVATGVLTITSIIYANKISSKQIAALAVAGGISERALQEHKEKIVEKLGIQKSEAIQEEIAQDRVTNNPPSNQVIIAGTGDVLCFESLTGRYFNSTIELVRKAENKVNYDIIHYDYCSLSVFFEEIGLAPTDYSDLVGWNVANRMEVRFDTTMSEDKRPCLVVGFVNMPSMDYDKSWT